MKGNIIGDIFVYCTLFILVIGVTMFVYVMLVEIPSTLHEKNLKRSEFCEENNYQAKQERVGIGTYVEYCYKIIDNTIEKRYVEIIDGEVYWTEVKK